MTGKQAWNAPGRGALTTTDGMLYCLEERGTMKLVEATPEAHRIAAGGRSRRKIAIVAVARRMLVIAWAMMRDGTEWRAETSALTA